MAVISLYSFFASMIPSPVFGSKDKKIIKSGRRLGGGGGRYDGEETESKKEFELGEIERGMDEEIGVLYLLT